MTVTDLQSVTVRKDSPLCGDVIDLTVGLSGGSIGRASHTARACSLVRASAAILDRKVPGLSVGAARELRERVAAAMRGVAPLPEGFDDVAAALLLPSRRKCVLLPWDALAEALGSA